MSDISLNDEFIATREAAIDAIFEHRAYNFSPDNVFTLRLEKLPAEAKSLIGQALALKIQRDNLLESPTWAAGVPQDGEELLALLQSALPPTQQQLMQQFHLTQTPPEHTIGVAPEYQIRFANDSQPALIVDAGVTTGAIKLQATDSIAQHGTRTIHLLVFLDMKAHNNTTLTAGDNVQLSSVWTFNQFLEYASSKGRITRQMCEQAISHPTHQPA